MSEVKLPAVPRTTFGKGAARQLRRDKQVPAVVYGHGTEPVHLALPAHATMLALKASNALLSIEVEGKTILALPKDVQRNALRGDIEHVDLLIVTRGEKVVVDVTIHVVGTALNNTIVTTEASHLSIECQATNIPTSVEVSVERLPGGTQILAGQIELPEGAVLHGDPEQTVVNVAAKGGGEEGEEGAAE